MIASLGPPPGFDKTRQRLRTRVVVAVGHPATVARQKEGKRTSTPALAAAPPDVQRQTESGIRARRGAHTGHHGPHVADRTKLCSTRTVPAAPRCSALRGALPNSAHPGERRRQRLTAKVVIHGCSLRVALILVVLMRLNAEPPPHAPPFKEVLSSRNIDEPAQEVRGVAARAD